MSARRRTRRRRAHAGEHENEERWLLTYADMITLLMALFMVLFSISSVNISKFKTLQRALQDAFSGRILPGGTSVQQTGDSDGAKQSAPTPPIAAITPFGLGMGENAPQVESIRQEDEDFQRLKSRIDLYARSHHLQRRLQTIITSRGLVIRVLTDRVLFDTAQADLKPRARPLLGEIARLVAVEGRHPIDVEGHTDSRPIHDARFPTNWELSAARSASVVRFLIGRGVARQRLQATGFAALHPIASNATAAGQARNRRVEIVLLRLGTTR